MSLNGIGKSLKELQERVSDQVWSPRKKLLPMYKDKPYGAHYKNNGRRKKLAVFGFFVGVFFYFVYILGKATKTSPRFLDVLGPNEPKTWKARQTAVRDAFKKSWNGYTEHAWGKDIYNVLSKTGKNMGPAPLGWIIVDSLDTMHLMGLKSEFRQARKWVQNHLNYDMNYEVNTFETTIRMLGGLLSAYYLTNDDLFLDKAVDLGNRLIPAFSTTSGIPYASVNLGLGHGVPSHADDGASTTAEVTTLQLEFKYLAYLTGEQLFWDKAEKVMEVIDRNHAEEGLVPIYIRPDSGLFQGNLIRVGSRGDSYYEYLIKQFLQTEEQEPIYQEMYEESIKGIQERLLKTSKPSNLYFIGELDNGLGGPLSNKMDHLVCFAGGMLALGATKGKTVQDARKQAWWSPREENQFTLGIELTRTCYEMYNGTATGLASEIVVFNDDLSSTEDFYIKKGDVHNLQRPETIESLFILWRLTGNTIYREWGWNIFKSFEKWTSLPEKGGYACLKDVTRVPPPMDDNMESFWLAETLKYFYLLFDESDPELCPLDKVVLNTEAHIFPKFPLGKKFKTGWERTLKPVTAL